MVNTTIRKNPNDKVSNNNQKYIIEELKNSGISNTKIDKIVLNLKSNGVLAGNKPMMTAEYKFEDENGHSVSDILVPFPGLSYTKSKKQNAINNIPVGYEEMKDAYNKEARVLFERQRKIYMTKQNSE